jgi:uncharacterized membrane protein
MGKGNLEHKVFLVSITLKGIDGLLEIIGGFLVLLLNQQSIGWIIRALTQHELSEDPNDLLANFLVSSIKKFSGDLQTIVGLYLLSHGIVKILLIAFLWRGNPSAYPAAIFFFAGFGIYQMYRYYFTHSVWLLALTVLDIGVIYLTWVEYKRIKGGRRR